MDTGSVGQIMEFLVWAALIGQSRGALHVFLPELDRGLDAVIHRRTDGEYIPVQVKCRTETTNGFVEIGIPEKKLVDDRALIIAGLLTAEDGLNELGPMLLVVDEGTFKRVAARSLVKGDEVYSASFNMDSSTSHWRPYLVSREELADRLLGPAKPIPSFGLFEDLSREEVDDYSRWLGFIGEQEVIRRIAFQTDLSLFRPYPDLEMVEVLARHNPSGRFLGLQVKTGEPSHYGEARLYIRKASFAPTPTTYFVGLAWIAEERRFADECLLVPSEHVVELAVDDGAHWVLNFHPHSQEGGRLDPYRRKLRDLGSLCEDVIG